MSVGSSSEQLDGFLSGSIEGLRGSMEKGFERVERQIGGMATKDVLRAEVERLNQRDDHLETRMDAGFAEIKSRVDAGFMAISTRDAERDRAAEARDSARDAKFARRLTWTLTGVGLAFAAWTTFVVPLLEHWGVL